MTQRDRKSFSNLQPLVPLFPEVRISAEFKQPVPYQENLAKQLGDKHRLIRGVAGSGKTLILASRAKLLSNENPDWKILILCYNISLSQGIKQVVQHMMS
jgi:superfamily I DNA and RNA helicase